MQAGLEPQPLINLPGSAFFAWQDPAYRATLLYICRVTHAVVRDMRKNLVEVLTRVRVNLRIFRGKIAGKRAVSRTSLENFKLQRS
jgi:hypothetical protein